VSIPIANGRPAPVEAIEEAFIGAGVEFIDNATKEGAAVMKAKAKKK
jgi:hypothetical protein